MLRQAQEIDGKITEEANDDRAEDQMSVNKYLIRLCSQDKAKPLPSEEMVKRLIEKGADIHAKDSNGLTSFHWCCNTNKIETAKLLLKLGAAINSRDNDGRTPLHFPCHSGSVDIVKMLLEEGADVNCKSNSGRTPLHKACSNGQIEVAKMLLAKNADVLAKDSSGRTAIHWCCLNGHTDIFSLLVENGANICETNDYGWTPLHKACYNGHKAICLLLVSEGADIDCEDNDGDTPLDIVESDDLKEEILSARQKHLSWARRRNFMRYLNVQYSAVIDQATGEPAAKHMAPSAFKALKPVDEVMIVLHRHIVSFI